MSRRPLSVSSVRWSIGVAAVLAALALSGPSVAQTSAAPAAAASVGDGSSPAAQTLRGRGPGRKMDRHHGHREHRGGSDRQRREASGDPVERVQQRLAHLKIDLKITPAQDKTWQAYVGQATRQAEARKAQQAKWPDAQAVAKMAMPERMALRTEQMKLRLAEREAMDKSFKTLFAALTPDQQTLAERHVGRGRGHRGR